MSKRDVEPDNSDRARWGEVALAAFMASTGLTAEDGPESCVSDLVADLMHFCDAHSIEWRDVEDRARMHYEAESDPNSGEPGCGPKAHRFANSIFPAKEG